MSVKTITLTVAVLAALMFAASSALADEAAPQWTVTSVSLPTNFKPGSEGKAGEDSYKVSVTNTGGGSSDGTPVTITDELPPGLSLDPSGASGRDQLAFVDGLPPEAGFACVLRTCTFTGTVVPDQTLLLTFPVDVSAQAQALSPLANVVRVAGGGAPSVSVSTPTAISSTPAGFGIAPGGATTALSSNQAGAHPDLTNTIAFTTTNPQNAQAEDFKNVAFDLPPGFAGDLVDTPSCQSAVFLTGECPVGTQVGVTTVTLTGILNTTFTRPVYNLSPNPGEVAKIGFIPGQKIPIEAGISVRPGDYGLRTVFADLPESLLEINNVSLTIWGVPASPVHDPLRWHVLEQGVRGGELGGFGASSDAALAPFFSNPTSCGSEPLHAEFSVTSYEHPDSDIHERMGFGPIVGCDRVTMDAVGDG